ncbi:MAG: hypothetical protein L0Y35_00315 [Flammeovirgaceae bacterium]|nr:hypothetical protein [Flammeovirgaceae bacterium]
MATGGWSIRFRPWIVVYTETFEKRIDALQREKQLKAGKGREWIRKALSEQFKQMGFISA